ncbi:MAG: hypothetical protein KDA65_03350 [Planctomycetaceae bacterium]|nr:hypothetical protein [Planctomycetaceae bacterium]
MLRGLGCFVLVFSLVMTGCRSSDSENAENTEAAPAGEQENNAAVAVNQPVKQQKVKGTTQDVGDYEVLIKENPNLVPISERQEGTENQGYIRTITSSMRDQKARASQFGLERAIQLYHAEHERYPSYDEFMKMLKDHRAFFPALNGERMYAYREKTGEVLTLREVIPDDDDDKNPSRD